MSLLDNLPHECTIRRRMTTSDGLARGKVSYEVERTGVSCWEQETGSSPDGSFQKKGEKTSHRVYFTEDPNLSRRHQILITKRFGVAVSSPVPLDVTDSGAPDSSAGMGVLWAVNCEDIVSARD